MSPLDLFSPKPLGIEDWVVLDSFVVSEQKRRLADEKREVFFGNAGLAGEGFQVTMHDAHLSEPCHAGKMDEFFVLVEPESRGHWFGRGRRPPQFGICSQADKAATGDKHPPDLR
jgi:hypothetical protein